MASFIIILIDIELDWYLMNTGKLKCYELYALLLTCCWEIFKLLFTLFIAPFVLFVYQRQHEKISAPVKCAALTRSFSDTYQRVNENRTKHFPWSNLYMVPVVLRCCIQWQNRSEVTSRGTEPFTLQRHKEELGKAYGRITLYLCKTTAIMDALFLKSYYSDESNVSLPTYEEVWRF